MRHERVRAELPTRCARLHGTRGDDRKLLKQFQRLAEALAPTRTPTDTARVLVQAGVEMLGARIGALGILSPDETTFDLAASSGLPAADAEAWRRFPNSGTIPWGLAARSRCAVFVTSRAKLDRYRGLGDTPRRLGLAAAYAIPLLGLDRRVLGVVGFSFADERPVPSEVRRLLDTFARQGALAMERALLYEREPVTFDALSRSRDGWVRVHAYPAATGLSVHLADIAAERELAAERASRARMADLLQRVTVATNHASTPTAALAAAVRAVCETLDWPVGHAYSVNGEVPSLTSSGVWVSRPGGAYAALQAPSTQLPLRPGVGLVGRAYAQRRSVALRDLHADPTFDRRDEARAAGLASGVAVPVLAEERVAGILEFFHCEPSSVDHLLVTLDQAGALIGRVIEREWARESRRRLLRRVAAAQEDERRWLARELHDNVGQHLTALQLQLRTLRAALRAPSREGRERERLVDEMEALLDALQTDAQQLVVELRPTLLDDLGLELALAEHVRRWTDQTGVPVDVHSATLEGARLPAAVETALYRTIQEALTNVARHSGANRVSLIFRRRDGALHAVLEDDGRGFDLAAVRRAPGARSSLGLLGMEERIADVDGTLIIESHPGRGTSVYIRVPLGEPDAATADLPRPRAG